MNYQFQPTCQIPPEHLDKIYTDAFGVKTDGTFAEFGAHDGWHWSCTWGLAEAGWRGLYAEPVKELYEECLKTNLSRPNVRVENCCIGRTNGTVTLGMAEWGAAAASDKELFEAQQYRLDDFLETCGFAPRFDLLVIDVEGAESDVLAGFDWKRWLPRLIIVERPPAEFDCLLESYDNIYEDWINAIYKRHDDT